MINPTYRPLITNKPKKFFGANDGAAIYALGIGALIILQFAVSFVIIGLSGASGEISALLSILASLLFQAGYVGIYFLYSGTARVKPTFRIKTKISPVWIAVGILAAPLCLFCFYGLAALFDVWLKNVGYNPGSAFEAGGLIQNIMIVVVTVIAAPIGEELIFRSGLLSGLKKKFNDIAAAALCGLAFSFMHMNPAQTVYQFFLGFAAAYLVLASGSIIPAILLHAANNLIAIMASLLKPIENVFVWYENVFLSNAWAALITSVVFTAAGVAIIIIGGSFLKKFEREKQRKRGFVPDEEIVTVLPYGGKQKSYSMFYIFLIIPFVVTALMWIFQFYAVTRGM